MMETLEFAIVIVYILIFAKLTFDAFRRDGFDSSKEQQKDARVKEILGNRELFTPEKASYTAAKSQIEWIDPVIYYDAVRLANINKLNIKEVRALI